jgi:hypothetical protein
MVIDCFLILEFSFLLSRWVVTHVLQVKMRKIAGLAVGRTELKLRVGLLFRSESVDGTHLAVSRFHELNHSVGITSSIGCSQTDPIAFSASKDPEGRQTLLFLLTVIEVNSDAGDVTQARMGS